jgi:hypothetical protein
MASDSSILWIDAGLNLVKNFAFCFLENQLSDFSLFADSKQVLKTIF